MHQTRNNRLQRSREVGSRASRRRALPLAVLLALLVLACGTNEAPPGGADATAGSYDLVLAGGRVMDPESTTDGILNIGVRDGLIAAISPEPLEGEEVVDVSGLVVAPGFIDLHAHGQDPVSARLQALDGVTTALDLEAGAYPVRTLLEDREGRAIIHFGASVSHAGARFKRFDGLELGHSPTLPPQSRPGSADSKAPYAESDEEDIEALLGYLDEGLAEGGLGIGMGIVYTPGASHYEIFRVFEHAARRGVPIFVHMRSDPSGPLADVQEVISDATATGASLHIVHLNSSTGELAPAALEIIRGARQRGIDVTTEAYPYTAGSTLIQSALFDSWEGRPAEAYQALEWPATGERLTPESFARYRKQGGWVIMHSRSEEINTWVTAQPDLMVASDGIPFLHGPAHPRGSGTFARVLGRYARDRQALSLIEALGKMTIQPARRLEGFSPQMRRKGRISLGADADLTIFDPERVIDRSTYGQGDLPSEGIEHVLVEGTFVVRDAELVEGVFPGHAIRSEIPSLQN